MFKSEGPKALSEVWINPFDVEELANAAGLSLPSVSNATVGFLIAKWSSDRGNVELPVELASIELKKDENEIVSFRASDFVRLIRMEDLRKVMRAKVRNFGKRAEEVALQLADYLEEAFVAG